MIAIINFGMGNLNSIKNKLHHHKIEAIITSEKHEIESADKLILPGVGNFKKGMNNLNNLNLTELLNHLVITYKKPIFGICLGMQLFANHSEEGNTKGLGLIDGDVKKFSFSKSDEFKIPHIGWNRASFIKEHSILEGINKDQYFYFTHSYHLDCQEDIVLAKTNYGYEFPSAILKDNILGVQFHPEKSHVEGFRMLINFCK